MDMDQVLWLIPLIAAVGWYSLFTRHPFSGYSNVADILEVLDRFPGTEGDEIIRRGSISRFDYWNLKRRYDKYVLAQLGIRRFEEVAGIEVPQLGSGLNAGPKITLRSGQTRKV